MTAVEWFNEQIEQYIFTHRNLSFNVLSKFNKQAKEMEKQQIIDAFCDSRLQEEFTLSQKLLDEYYNETYGNNGSDSTLNSSLNSTLNSSFQIEISDEEIEKCNYTFFKDGVYFIADEISFKEGAKWYREQLKKKQ